ncbi:hypothetical protein HJC10_08110 [Corallococcus exiguus]|uniref:hypothetical protein n=1 Tax=Corallococcus TaxID=83461 RepID=UPI000EEBB951|nr:MULTISPECIES: hypothetical protein [Corallococcus]NNB87346.1 hypothetical protein [Corallococcus exiguus]NNB97093.1 hypothetical protein [Corallococcus exiguus]NNC02816.1 hypothetical protein [Corallococcus exiguus]NPC47525.1 hypothetical protein [Corallococcus exiguus]RKH82672.1 hypothetical protein D7X99_14770 [Corallococcus sp. AB032C]
MLYRARVLLDMDREDMGCNWLERMQSRFKAFAQRPGEDTDPRMRALVSTALMGRALVLLREEFLPEALSAIDAILEHAGPNPGRRLMEPVNFAKFHREFVERELQLERERAARRPKPR